MPEFETQFGCMIVGGEWKAEKVGLERESGSFGIEEEDGGGRGGMLVNLQRNHGVLRPCLVQL